MKRPACSWPEFLEAAPEFLQLLWLSRDFEFDADTAPLVRAAAYFDIFDGEIANGGVTQYFFNQAFALPDFEQAPDIVAQHPMLEDLVPLLRDAHVRWKEVAEEVTLARSIANAASVSDDQEGFIEAAFDLFDTHDDANEEFHQRYFAMNETVRMRLLRAVLEDFSAYFEIASLQGVSGSGVEIATAEGCHGRWRLRFVDGFPVGPNILESEGHGPVRIVRFTPDRLHVECDGYVGSSNAFDRKWVDFHTGLSCTRRFKDGRLVSAQTNRNLRLRHGISEQCHPDGRAKLIQLCLDDEDVASVHTDHARQLFSHTIHVPGEGAVRRGFFPTGELNTISVTDDDGRVRYRSCLNEAGEELAPGGDGVLREYLGVTDKGPRWREGRLVGGYADGEVRWLNGEEVMETERYTTGRRVTET